MTKLMKYEFRKQVFSKIIILILLGLAEAFFLYGALLGKEAITAITIIILVLLTQGVLFYVAFESIITYSNDLKTKNSYMLFLTPRSSYQIIGAKVITAGIQILLAGLVFLAVGIGDIMLLVTKYDAIAELKEFIVRLIQVFTNVDIDDRRLMFFACLMLLLAWIQVIIIGFFSITLSTTLLANKKYKGLISLIFFIAINMAVSWISNKLFRMKVEDTTLILQSLYYICITGLGYVGTAWLIDKKLCV